MTNSEITRPPFSIDLEREPANLAIDTCNSLPIEYTQKTLPNPKNLKDGSIQRDYPVEPLLLTNPTLAALARTLI